ncbi:hypothetical protein [Amycolatopsis magusensis]|uniref:hypothetical protein n=1 Tax=Amycolatopsis magusensis TaxID=882444 RepID=UPI0037B04087
MRATWTHQAMVSAPFADFTWRHARQSTATSGEPVNETAIARTLDELLTRAGAGPDQDRSAADQKVAARTRAAAEVRPPAVPVDSVDPVEEEDLDDGFGDGPAEDEQLGTVIPFGVFDARVLSLGPEIHVLEADVPVEAQPRRLARLGDRGRRRSFRSRPERGGQQHADRSRGDRTQHPPSAPPDPR